MPANNRDLKKAMVIDAFRHEMQLAAEATSAKALNLAFRHYERAHILSQKYTFAHTRSHIGMLRIGLIRKDMREIFGQCIRVIAALAFSKIWVPIGNTGGTNVSALKPMPIPEDLKILLEELQ